MIFSEKFRRLSCGKRKGYGGLLLWRRSVLVFRRSWAILCRVYFPCFDVLPNALVIKFILSALVFLGPLNKAFKVDFISISYHNIAQILNFDCVAD